MKIRNKILFYFSSAIIILSAVSLGIIYFLFSEHREEEFQQQQNAKIKQTIDLIKEFKQMSMEISDAIDRQRIHDFYDEKMLIFDHHKNLIFSSLDDLSIAQANKILTHLSPSKRWIETKDGDYDLIGVYIEDKKESYYAISKAYDTFGYSKRNFLGKVLIGIWVSTVIIVVFLSLYLSNLIAKPIMKLSGQLNHYDPNKDVNEHISLNTTTYEIQNLVERFNALLQRTNDAFAYQKHTVNHISHELKTPLAVLVSELEKLEKSTDPNEIKEGLENQIVRAKSLGGIINALLEIAKIESGQHVQKRLLRVDELIFDCVERINVLHASFHFEINYTPVYFDESRLELEANEDLLRHAFQNLLLNCIAYSDNQKAEIQIDCSQENVLSIRIINTGQTIAKEEEKYLFSRFFRGKNSHHKAGFGLGLVLTQKIVQLHNGQIHYKGKKNINTFELVWKRE